MADALDLNLPDRSPMQAFEKTHVLDLNSGQKFITTPAIGPRDCFPDQAFSYLVVAPKGAVNAEAAAIPEAWFRFDNPYNPHDPRRVVLPVMQCGNGHGVGVVPIPVGCLKDMLFVAKDLATKLPVALQEWGIGPQDMEGELF